MSGRGGAASLPSKPVAAGRGGFAEWNRPSFEVERHHVDGRGGDADGLAGVVADRVDLDGDADAPGADAGCAGVELDDVAQVDRGDEIDPFHGGRDPGAVGVPEGLDHRGLVEVAQNHAAEDGAVGIRVPRHGHDAEGEGPVRLLVGCGFHAGRVHDRRLLSGGGGTVLFR